ncbi:flagellar protein FliS [Nitratiruptor sp. YY08-26]|uniref:flagellar export chaperone FliS n=1 Tax=unclassified Nitratiruptor TaxID=2624044 RepID=UPI001915ECDA|nr:MULTISPECIES: flagellar export chaperone FliS [unclassified Nitratiruptor]BCD61883.1 flagellar protein FliS [Nitratiruptor sp. YY08-13]BCD65818.1 flagellar protein FliS [Nitratiruptor sp. YY08-26]
MQNPYEVYLKNQDTVNSQEELLLKTFENILAKLDFVKMAIEEQQIEVKAREIGKLIDVLEIMRNSLDFEHGREVAKNLDAIYAFCIDELIKANATNDHAYIQNVKEILLPIKEGFEQVAK